MTMVLNIEKTVVMKDGKVRLYITYTDDEGVNKSGRIHIYDEALESSDTSPKLIDTVYIDNTPTLNVFDYTINDYGVIILSGNVWYDGELVNDGSINITGTNTSFITNIDTSLNLVADNGEQITWQGYVEDPESEEVITIQYIPSETSDVGSSEVSSVTCPVHLMEKTWNGTVEEWTAMYDNPTVTTIAEKTALSLIIRDQGYNMNYWNACPLYCNRNWRLLFRIYTASTWGYMEFSLRFKSMAENPRIYYSHEDGYIIRETDKDGNILSSKDGMQIPTNTWTLIVVTCQDGIITISYTNADNEEVTFTTSQNYSGYVFYLELNTWRHTLAITDVMYQDLSNVT